MLTYFVRAFAFGHLWHLTCEADTAEAACAAILAHFALPRDTVAVARSA